MKTLNFPQRSPEWFAARKGLPTASRFDQILTPVTAKPSSSQDKLINELIAESLGLLVPEDEGATAAMENGINLEDEARAAYELEWLAPGQPMKQAGLLISDCGRFGASPDLLVGDLGGVEIKVPTPTTQISYLRANAVPSDYRCQIHGLMIVSDRDWWDFWSYCRGLQPLRVRVMRDDFTLRLAEELNKFCDRYNEARARFGLAAIGGAK